MYITLKEQNTVNLNDAPTACCEINDKHLSATSTLHDNA